MLISITSVFLQLAVRAAADFKIASSTPTVSVELPQARNPPPSKSSSIGYLNGDATTPPSLQSVSLESPMLPRGSTQQRTERIGMEPNTTAARIDPSYFERATNEQQKIGASSSTNQVQKVKMMIQRRGRTRRKEEEESRRRKKESLTLFFSLRRNPL